MQNAAASESWRLLRVLLLRFSEMSADPAVWLLFSLLIADAGGLIFPSAEVERMVVFSGAR
jgi:hypothetical protein